MRIDVRDYAKFEKFETKLQLVIENKSSRFYQCTSFPSRLSVNNEYKGGKGRGFLRKGFSSERGEKNISCNGVRIDDEEEEEEEASCAFEDGRKK